MSFQKNCWAASHPGIPRLLLTFHIPVMSRWANPHFFVKRISFCVITSHRTITLTVLSKSVAQHEQTYWMTNSANSARYCCVMSLYGAGDLIIFTQEEHLCNVAHVDKRTVAVCQGLTIRVGVSSSPGAGHLVVQVGGWSNTHAVVPARWCNMAQGLRMERRGTF